MKIQLDDPKLTAYALKEMDDSERVAFEQLLREDPDAQREAEAIRATTEMLMAELAKEPQPALTNEQRWKLNAAMRQEHPRVQVFPRCRCNWLRRLATAACLLLVVGALAAILLPRLARQRESAPRMTPELRQKIAAVERRTAQSAPPPTAAAPAPAPAVPASLSAGTRDQLETLGYLKDLNGKPRSEHLQVYSIATKPGTAEQRSRLNVKGYFDGIISTYETLQASGTPTGEREPHTAFGATSPTLPPGTEAYAEFIENRFLAVRDEALSTFSIDVDTAAYANVRRFLEQGTLPPVDVVRIEEMLNYFKYDYPQPQDEKPFFVNVEINPCPWNTEHLLARIGLQGKNVPMDDRPACNLVFLLDVSGSMDEPNKLPLLVKGMKVLAASLSPRDSIGIVTYNETPRVALEPTSCREKERILAVLDGLRAGGSTNGAGGIRLAYDVAWRNFAAGRINRVVLATDGDFNVRMSETDQLVQMIAGEAKSGVFLNVLGFGTGNLKDTNLQGLADKGNGQYAYIDSFKEARRVLLDKIAGTLVTIAKDVKIQVEFNPAKVGAYRLIGYEKRVLAAKDFNDDTNDAGEIGAGHTVTALYELIPPGKPMPAPNVDALKYQPAETPPSPPVPASTSNELMTVKLRYKLPNDDSSTRFDVPVAIVGTEPSPDFRFAAGVAAFGMILRNSEFKGTVNLDLVADLAQQGKGNDPDGARAEFIDLVKTAKALVK